ncbi:MAG: hypothetical protein ACREXX_22550 [Gammaproteobacteria bacterium]
MLLIEEIDKAPRDFPNNLLHELDKMEFRVIETGQPIQAPAARRPMVFITSNSERRLPEPFLRRCVYHHIRFDSSLVERAVKAHSDEYGDLSPDFLRVSAWTCSSSISIPIAAASCLSARRQTRQRRWNLVTLVRAPEASSVPRAGSAGRKTW